MKKFYFLLLVLCLMSIKTLYSQDVINLGVTDGIGAKLNAYVGTNTDVTVIVPVFTVQVGWVVDNVGAVNKGFMTKFIQFLRENSNKFEIQEILFEMVGSENLYRLLLRKTNLGQ